MTGSRRSMVLGVAAAAAAVGAGAAWWRSLSGDPAVDALWTLRFEAPTGPELVLAELRGKPLLLNFWATWCPPCVTEMPLIDRFHRERRGQGWQVVGLAVDSPTPVREWLAQRAISFPIGLAGLAGTELSRSLGNSSGALPFTVVFDRSGQPVMRKLGSLSADDLEAWAARFG
jgi:thiol-disulfide isomerase/thioredoxin